MDGQAADEVGRRIGLFCIGMTLATFFGFVGWVAFVLSNENFYADWWQGWADARERLVNNPGLAVVVGLSVAFVAWGLGCAMWAVVGCHTQRNTKVGS